MKEIVVRAFGLSPMCRVCLSDKKCMYNIFSKCFDDMTLATAIMTCAPVQISSYDDLPSVVCERCAKELERFAKLRERCIESDKVLRKYNNALTPHKFEFVDLTGDPLSNAYEFAEEPAVLIDAGSFVETVRVRPALDTARIEVENGEPGRDAPVERNEPEPKDGPVGRPSRRPRYDYGEYDDDDFETGASTRKPIGPGSKRKRKNTSKRDAKATAPGDVERFEKKRNKTVESTDDGRHAARRTELAAGPSDRSSHGRT